MREVWVRMGLLGAFVIAGCGAGEEHAVESSYATENGALEARSSAAQASLEAAVTDECGQACLVRQWIQDERYAEARDILRTDLQDTPLDVEKTLLMTAAQFGDELYDDAYELTSSLLTEVNDVRLLERRALASLLAHDVETAAHDFSETIASLQGYSNETRRSICDVISGRCASPLQREAYAWLGLATAEFNRRNLTRAAEIVGDLENTTLFQGMYDPAAAHFIRALIASRSGDDETAAALYEGILAKYPTDPGTLVNLGGIAYRNGDLVSARDYQTRAFEHAGRHRRVAAIAWSNVAEIDMLEGDYDAALEKVNEALQISRGFAGGYFQRGVIQDLIGDVDASRQSIAKGLTLDVQGVARWNITMFDANWEAHFAALVAESAGNTRTASHHWHSLLTSRHAVLADVAKRHLNRLAEHNGSSCGR